MIEERVFKIIKDNIEVEIDHELTPDDSIDDLKINSISFIKIIVGIFIFWSAWNSIRVCACTPSLAEITKIAPSRTDKERYTSVIKSVCPGVSTILIL